MDRLVEVPDNLKGQSVRLILNPSNVARDTLLYALETGFIEDKTTQIQSFQNINCYLIVLVVHGKGILEYESTRYELCKGDIFLIDCNKKYNLFSTSKYGWTILYLHFNGIAANGYFNIISKMNSPVMNLESTKTISALLWQIITLHKKKNKSSEYITSLHITRILTDFIMLNINDIVEEAEYPEFINRVFNHIGKYYSERITLDMLSELYFVNKFYLAREFKRYSGFTVNDHIITTRINKAKELLRYSNMNVENIAIEVGFNSASHFIRLFKKREHVTPLYFRKQWTK